MAKIPPLFLCILLTVCAASQMERELYTKLLEKMNIAERPVERAEDAVMVNVSLMPITLDVHEKRQVLILHAWIAIRWKTYNLAWNPAEFGNVSKIVVPKTGIWTPDLTIYHSIDTFRATADLTLTSDGMVTWFPSGIFHISCKLQIQFFPFDEQICYAKIGSWAYSGNEIDLDPVPVLDLSAYTESGEWLLIEKGTNATHHIATYNCCPETYPSSIFYFHLRRRSVYYITNFILPCCFITIVSFAGLLLPAVGGEKATLQVTVMLAVAVFMQLTMNMTPETSESVPLMSIFFGSCFAMVALAMMVTTVTQNMHHCHSHRMSKQMRTLFLYLCPRLLLMAPFEHVKWNAREVDEWSDHSEVNDPISKETQEIQKLMQGLHMRVKKIEMSVLDTQTETLNKEEWKMAARVTDRLCFVILTCALVGAVMYTLLRPPYSLAY